MDIKIHMKSSLKIYSPNLSKIDKFGKAKHSKPNKLGVYHGRLHPPQMPKMFRECDTDPAPARGIAEFGRYFHLPNHKVAIFCARRRGSME